MKEETTEDTGLSEDKDLNKFFKKRATPSESKQSNSTVVLNEKSTDASYEFKDRYFIRLILEMLTIFMAFMQLKQLYLLISGRVQKSI